MTPDRIKKILEDHKAWRMGQGGKRADLSGADLSRADLSRADLSGADLSGADLRGAVLRGAVLSGAVLIDADLSRADLSGADLSDADLRGAVLRGADLSDAVGNKKQMKTLVLEIWTVTYTNQVMQIGCQNHLIADWFNFSDKEISKMDCRALDWWKKWKEPLRQIIELSPAEPTGSKEGLI